MNMEWIENKDIDELSSDEEGEDCEFIFHLQLTIKLFMHVRK